MGNRAVITTKEKKASVYLHWNGGRDSVEAFLEYCKRQGQRSPDQDCYGWARLCQVIGNFFGGSTSLGIGHYDELDTDNHDNGVYIIKGWEIIGREFAPDQEQNQYPLEDMIAYIDARQPPHLRLKPLCNKCQAPFDSQDGSRLFCESCEKIEDGKK